MSRSNTISGQLIGGGFVAWGAILTLKYMGIISFEMRHIWPLLLILGGLAVIFKDKLISETQVGWRRRRCRSVRRLQRFGSHERRECTKLCGELPGRRTDSSDGRH
jgi:hypothetical protein